MSSSDITEIPLGEGGPVVQEAGPLWIAVLGDVHGHLTLAYRVLSRWQKETGYTLDAILQVGDLGAYPPPFRLDSATKRFAEADPDELGFAQYYEGSAEADEVHAPDAPPARRIDAETYFIKGNHEDFVFLAELTGDGSTPVPVDPHSRILYVPSGTQFVLERRERRITIAALGGIAWNDKPGAAHASMHYTRNELRRVRSFVEPVDVLLTHEPPFGAAVTLHEKYAESGSSDVLSLVRELSPAYHFCGHYHEAGARLEVPAPTESFELNAVHFERPNRLASGCIGILRWESRERHTFGFLSAPWLAEFNRNNYRQL